MEVKAFYLGLLVMAVMVVAVVFIGSTMPPKVPYSCGGTHTYGPDGTLVCTGGLP